MALPARDAVRTETTPLMTLVDAANIAQRGLDFRQAITVDEGAEVAMAKFLVDEPAQPMLRTRKWRRKRTIPREHGSTSVISPQIGSIVQAICA